MKTEVVKFHNPEMFWTYVFSLPRNITIRKNEAFANDRKIAVLISNPKK